MHSFIALVNFISYTYAFFYELRAKQRAMIEEAELVRAKSEGAVSARLMRMIVGERYEYWDGQYRQRWVYDDGG